MAVRMQWLRGALTAMSLAVALAAGCGAGSDACRDECSRRGARACDQTGLNGYQVCAGDWDTDACLEWGPLNACEEYQTCSVGVCEGEPPSCEDACTAGEVRCAAPPANAVEACGDFDADPCLEWGGATPCDAGVCADGACPGACSDTCSPEGERVCEGDGYRICTDADGDGCLGWSEVEACGPDMTCEDDGSCCIEEGEDCEDYDDCCACFHCCPVLEECVPDWWDPDC